MLERRRHLIGELEHNQKTMEEHITLIFTPEGFNLTQKIVFIL